MLPALIPSPSRGPFRPRRAFRRALGVVGPAGLLAAAIAGGPATGHPPESEKPRPEPAGPSILLVTIDTLRADRVGCYGYAPAETPNLDRLAREGVLFEKARSHTPITLPSHGTILTGRLPPRHGLRGNSLFRLPDAVPTLAGALRATGYGTAAVVSSVVLDRVTGLDRGFDRYDDNQRVGPRSRFGYLERGASQVADAAERELETLSPPFFLWVHLYDPHVPWVAPAPWSERHPGRGYDAEIAFADDALGRIRRSAERIAGGRLVTIALSDHGESLGEHGENQHGYTLHRGVLRVPLVMAGPGIPAGSRIRETVGLADLAPTIAHIGGARLDGADGRSLTRFFAPAGAASGAASGASALWEESFHPYYDSGWAPLRGLLTDRWHFVEAPRPELYDRRSDPSDGSDIASKFPGIVDRLAGRLRSLAEEIGDTAGPPPPSASGREHLSRLSSLGYLSSGSDRPPAGGRLDPKDGLPGILAVERAGELLAQQRAEDARRLLAPHLETDPTNPRLWHQLAMARAAAGADEEADAALRRAARLAPDAEFIRYTHASLLADRGETAAAEALLAEILAGNPRAVEATLQLAALAAARGDRERSESLLRASLAAGAVDPDLFARLGIHHLERKELVDAEAMFRRALELYAGHPVAALEAGRAALRRGDATTAAELFARCADGDRAFECRMETARAAWIASGDPSRARPHIEAARAVARDERMRREADLRLAEIERLAGEAPPAPGP